MATTERYIGLMSGTSLDGVDGALVAFDTVSSTFEVCAFHHLDYPRALREEWLALNTSGPDELHRAALAANALALLQAEVIEALVECAGGERSSILAVGSHGQTVRHRPGECDGLGYTLQINQGALLAERCGIDVVCDFRSRDVAAGGQGAPLVPAFHQAAFGGTAHARALLNLGGIANLSVLPARQDPQARLIGFDCGPGNALLDGWAQRHLGTDFDESGLWAAQGTAHSGLLALFLEEPFLAAPPPKSTGRDLFNQAWLDLRLAPWNTIAPVDVQATLAELTARAATDAIRAHAPQTTELLCCGGGVFNQDLMARIARALPDVQVSNTQALGLDPMHIEAAAFAWLARAFIRRDPGNVTWVTGARGSRVLGALYPAGLGRGR
jgi:anhydro-N-acetylmuramic acid kinase